MNFTNRFVMGVKTYAVGDSKLNDSQLSCAPNKGLESSSFFTSLFLRTFSKRSFYLPSSSVLQKLPMVCNAT